MRTFLKYAGIVIGVFILVVGGWLLYINISGIPTYEVDIPEVEFEYTAERIERGKKLGSMLCAGCHRAENSIQLTGGRMKDVPPEFGEIYTKNITADKEHGIGNWTDGELIYLIRTGLKPDGQYIPPYMAKLPHLADEDMYSIIAWLRSGDTLVAASPVPDRESEPSFLNKFLTHVAFKPIPYPEQEIPMPDTVNTVELGRYLTFNMECFSCHSADFASNDYANPEKSVGYMAGGNKPLNRQGQVMLTQNLTPDAETGIGKWTPEQFVQVVKYGIKEGETAMRYPMQPYAHLTDYEVRAIYDYIMTIPPITNDVPRSNLE